MEVWDGEFHPLHTAEEWGKATEQCKTNKRLFALRATNVSANLKTLREEDIDERVEPGSVWMKKVARLSGLDNMVFRDSVMDNKDVFEKKDYVSADKKIISSDSVSEKIAASGGSEIQKRLSQLYDKVLVVNSVDAARNVVKMLTNKYKNFVHACDTE
ncbi:hypothetical protein CASFOL_019083 [Castilleja foliolosa]|uniref:Uncharacterized protein n=1 Tax=Castilleja foliolosa TaxID=1961234 RepID=A0ABD3D668_9LAMI